MTDAAFSVDGVDTLPGGAQIEETMCAASIEQGDRSMMRTPSEVMTLRAREGFTEHFAVRDDHLFGLDSGMSFDANEVVIRGFDRFEGVSDPDDEEIVYAIETVTGLRGTLTDAFGVYASPVVGAFMGRVAFDLPAPEGNPLRSLRQRPPIQRIGPS